MDGPALPSSPESAKVSLDGTLGAAFLGHFVTTLLFGITSLQAFMYYRRNKTDGTKLKFSVLIIWILDSVHAGLITGAIYWYCITNFTNLLAVQRPIWPIPTMIIISNVSNSIVRYIFGYRLWKLSNHNRIFPAVIAFLSIFIFVDAAYFAVKLYSIPSYSDIIHFSWSLYLGLSVEATVDLIVAATQCLLLRRLETGIQRTDSVIRILITYSINTGLLTSFCAIGALVSYAAAPTKFIYFAFYFALSKLYVNSLLATLNARGSLLGNARRNARRRGAESKVVFRTMPTLSTDPSSSGSYDPSSPSHMEAGENIEFTTIISTGSELPGDEIRSILKDDKPNELVA
ncbi:hypothetical protein PYCCODRAFT_1435582 [Trametes coccinea BRFM310]|uniref:DUF6534 domain-containing protein n=1 Tax=Trametes coccinea (strain BRFM310) TaxID=1353009 RepID=A0A1Y2IPW2_TRAC3|nr:hypothetical protein PYCCODRAFT_1435582 [Trametes coccinea BRFM310]